jgi:hypothetical protein
MFNIIKNRFRRQTAIMPDGTVYVGLSPTDGRPMYAMPHDLAELHTWDGAAKAAAAQTFADHTDWRVPTKEELDMLYLGKNAVGGFQRNWYWSSSKYKGNDAWVQTFDNGNQGYANESDYFRVRCVRSG